MVVAADPIKEYLSEHDTAHTEWRTELETAFAEHDAELQEIFRHRGAELEGVFQKYENILSRARMAYTERCQKASQKYQGQLDDIFTRNQKERNYSNVSPVPDSNRTPACP